uniref:MHC-H13 n=1 Tax=Hemiscolopendra marginata TaxID=943146 RepID=A0A646QDK2_9MYRI
MADIVNETLAQVNENLTENAKNGTTKPVSTPEGMAVAYGSLLIMAVLPIFFGSFRSVKHHKEKKESGEKPDTMTQKDAAMFPVIASVALFSLYLFFQIFSKEYINLLLTGYFFVLGVLALSHLLSPLITNIVPEGIPNSYYHLVFTKNNDEKKGNDEAEDKKETIDIINYSFDHKDLVCLFICSIIGIWYLWKKHWIANNLFGLAFAISGVELLHLNNIVTGCILLGGLFFYDIFWVFGTDVMVTVAKSFEAPIKLVFPQDLLEKGFEANNFAMLGLGDIVIPGIFIALLLRYDNSLQRRYNTYFNAGFVAYILGLMGTIFVMHVFKHAQPALLYLVPSCIGAPVFLALIKGDVKTMFQYEDHPSEESSGDEKAKEAETSDSKKEK